MACLMKRAAEFLVVFEVFVVSLAADNETTAFLPGVASLHPATTVNSLTRSLFRAPILAIPGATIAGSTVNTTRWLNRSPVGSQPVRHSAARGLPPTPSTKNESRTDPYFDGPEPQNITARVGSTIWMDCSLALLRNKTVNSHEVAPLQRCALKYLRFQPLL